MGDKKIHYPVNTVDTVCHICVTLLIYLRREERKKNTQIQYAIRRI